MNELGLGLGENTMHRSKVKNHVVMIPMAIKVQREGEHFVAVLPAWQLPIDNLVTSSSYTMAVEMLQERMRRHWCGPTEQPNTPINGERSESAA
jgi:hypothetical protein